MPNFMILQLILLKICKREGRFLHFPIMKKDVNITYFKQLMVNNIIFGFIRITDTYQKHVQNPVKHLRQSFWRK